MATLMGRLRSLSIGRRPWLTVALVAGFVPVNVRAEDDRPNPRPASRPSAPTSRPGDSNSDGETPQDEKAIALAERVMEKLGGRDAWEETRFLGWRFFSGDRQHYWDRETGDLRLEWDDVRTSESMVVLMNLRTREGRVWEADRLVEDPERKAELLDHAYKAWVNDSYWLLMPYKLRDPGVNLRHLGVRRMADERKAEVLEVTFDPGTGLTPGNEYHVYVAEDTGLVEQWDYYQNVDDEGPRFSTSWTDWQEIGGIRLASGRGRYRIEAIRVFETLPRSVFEDPSPVTLPANGPEKEGDGG